MVIAIMGIIASISLFNFNGFNSELALTNLAYEVALDIREAQVFGGGVKVSGTAGSASFDKAYGVYFDTNTPSQFISFVDTNDNRLYDSDESTAVHTLQRNNKISSICRIVNNSNPCVGNGEPFVHITFLRPSLDARVEFSSSDPAYKGVFIKLQAPDGKQKGIRIEKTGQISIENI